MFAEMIKSLRAEKGLSQSQLAKEVGVSTGNIGDWEIGRSKPGYVALVALSRYFGVPSDYLLGLTGDRNQKKGEPLVCDGEPLSEAEADLVAMYRLISAEDRKTIFDLTTLKYEQSTGERGSVYSTYTDTNEPPKNGSNGEPKSHHEAV